MASVQNVEDITISEPEIQQPEIQQPEIEQKDKHIPKRGRGRPRLTEEEKAKRQAIKDARPKRKRGPKRTRPSPTILHECEVCHHEYRPYNTFNHVNSRYHKTAVSVLEKSGLPIPEMKTDFL